MKPITAFAAGLLMLANVSCNRQSGKGKEACVEKPCESACTKEYRPVCGCNQKTYGNACMAECHGITDYTQGECPDKK